MENINLTHNLLTKIYNELNRDIFNNELPKIPIVLSRAFKKSAGVYIHVVNKNSRKVIPRNITISLHINHTLNSIVTLLAHEMIHLKDSLVNPDYCDPKYDPHGSFFQTESERIKSGFNINIEKIFKMNNGATLKGTINMVLFSIRGKKHMISCSDGYVVKIASELLDKFPNVLDEIYVVKVPKSDAESYTREFRSIKSAYPADDIWDLYCDNPKYDRTNLTNLIER